MSAVDKIIPLPRKPIAAERVADQLKELIRTGNLKAGDVLPSENELAGAFNVSRPVVREALRGLQILGLVETRQGGRCCVSDLDVARLVQPFGFVLGLTEGNIDALFAARFLVECGLLRLGAEAVTEEKLAELRAMVEAGFALSADPVGFRILDLAFHGALMSLAGNPFLEAAAKGYYGLGLEHRRTASETPGVIARSAAEHAGIVAALEARDPDRAAEAMRTHLVSINRTTIAAMRRAGAGADDARSA